MQTQQQARRILLVEDDDDLRAAIADALDRAGHHVVSVDNGREALDHMRSDRLDAVVLDLMMPVMDGWQFRVEQRRDPALAAIPVVAISASNSSAAAAIDVDLFLPKPCSVPAILAAIDDVIAARARRDQPAHAAQLERMAALGTLAAGIAHEINNPLTYVLIHLTHAERILAAMAPGPERAAIEQVTTLVGTALEGASRIRDIADGVRTFSRTDQRPAAPIDLRGPLEAALRLVGNELRLRARLVRVDGPLPVVAGDESRLAQVFLNLLTNAIHALPEGRADRQTIRIETSTDDDGHAVVEIADTGCGIPDHLHGHVFEPFFTTKPPGRGTGLGLSISHAIVRAAGGHIELASEVGRGTTVRVTLPACASARSARRRREAAS